MPVFVKPQPQQRNKSCVQAFRIVQKQLATTAAGSEKGKVVLSREVAFSFSLK